MYQLQKLTALIVIVLLPIFASAAPQGPVIGTVTLTLGDVRGVDQDGDTFEVKRGTELHAGYSFETGARSFVRARMLDGTRFTLSQNGSASLDSYSFTPTSNAGGFTSTVRRGGFRYQSGLLGSAGSSRVHSLINTPSGEIGVRGTVIEAVLQSDGTLQITVPEGNISITITRTDGTRSIQTLGQDEPNQNAEVTVDGNVTTLADIPVEVQAEINTLIELVNEVETAVDGTGSEDSGEESDEEEAEEGVLDSETEAAIEESFTAEEDIQVQLDTEAESATITQQAPGGGVTEEEASISTLQP